MSGWTVRLADRAAQDIEDILDWTLERFGPLQLESYADIIYEALETLSSGPQQIGVRRRPELGEDVATLHVARQGRKGRHLVVFRIRDQDLVIEVLRVLHDSMDIARHLDA